MISCFIQIHVIMRHVIKGMHCIWASRRENLSSGFENNEGPDQPAHLHRLISAFVIHFLERIIIYTRIYKGIFNFLASLCS